MTKRRKTARVTSRRSTGLVRATFVEPAAPLRPHPVAGFGFLRLDRSDEVATEVIDAIHRAANYPAELIQLNYVLQEQPLGLDGQDLQYLAESLTALVHRTRPERSVSRAEISSAGLKVGDVINLVKGKLS